MTLIDLSADEMKIVEALAEEKDITINEAAQIIFTAGTNAFLEDAAPITMALRRILRDSKRSLSNLPDDIT